MDAVICSAVFHLPRLDTFTALCASPPEAAAHSRSEDIVISRAMISATGTVIQTTVSGGGGWVARSTNAVDTMTLSATGSRNAPKAAGARAERG